MSGGENPQALAAKYFTGDWVAGPTLSDEALDAIKPLEEAGLIERRFGDDGPPVQSIGEDSITVRLSACWHFRLTADALLAHRQESEQ